MIKVRIYTTGRCKERWLQEALAEYEKRLTGQMEIEWILDIQKITPPWIALDPNGELVSSPAKKLSKFGSRLNFLIGGPDGIEKNLLEKSAWIWSLSPLTFTHQMTRLILLEQLYRINAPSQYQK